MIHLKSLFLKILIRFCVKFIVFKFFQYYTFENVTISDIFKHWLLCLCQSLFRKKIVKKFFNLILNYLIRFIELRRYKIYLNS
jgi:hypothetical protein